jgi:anti-sigma regulatory factor (Ser/Thr protein kinase)
VITAEGGQVEADMEARHQYPADVKSVTAARRMVAAWLMERGDDAIADTAALLTCELAQNAVRHAETGFTVDVSDHGGTIRIEVRDGGRVFPRFDATRSRGGKGLVLVDALSTRWGVIEVADGKVVWFELGPSAADA